MIAEAGISAPSYSVLECENLDLHAFQFFKRQIFEQRATRRGQVMLHWIS